MSRRSRAGPGAPAAAPAASTARRVAARPNGTTSIGSGKRPSTGTHFDSSAITIMRADAAATIFSRSSAPPPPLIRRQVGRDLVGAVDRQVELGRLVERRQRNAKPLGLRARRLRGRHRDDVEAGAHALAQQLDEMPRGRAGAEPEPHARAHEFDRAGGGGTFLGLDVHWRAGSTVGTAYVASPHRLG